MVRIRGWSSDVCSSDLGVTIGLTSHDRDLEIGHLLYRAAPGMTPSAVRSGIGVEGADSDVEGALVADAISEADLAAGRWEGAGLELRLTEWEAAGDLWLLLARGVIGAVTRKAAAVSRALGGGMSSFQPSAAPPPCPAPRAALAPRTLPAP